VRWNALAAMEVRVETIAPRPPTSMGHDTPHSEVGTRNPLRECGGTPPHSTTPVMRGPF